MKGGSDIVSTVQHIRMAMDHCDSFINQHPGTKGAKLFDGYRSRLQWILNDLKTHPALPEGVRAGLKAEIEGDVFTVPAIAEKIALVPPQQRETIEALIDGVLNGESINIIKE